MRRIWSGARTHLRNGKPISIEGRRRKRRRDSGRPWRPLCAGRTRGPRPRPRPRFRPAVSAGIRRAYPCDAVSQRESRTRAVKASREVVCPIPRHAVILTGVIFTRRRARIGAAPLRLAYATPSVRGHPRSGRLFPHVITNIISPCGQNYSSRTKRQRERYGGPHLSKLNWKICCNKLCSKLKVEKIIFFLSIHFDASQKVS